VQSLVLQYLVHMDPLRLAPHTEPDASHDYRCSRQRDECSSSDLPSNTDVTTNGILEGGSDMRKLPCGAIFLLMSICAVALLFLLCVGKLLHAMYVLQKLPLVSSLQNYEVTEVDIIMHAQLRSALGATSYTNF